MTREGPAEQGCPNYWKTLMGLTEAITTVYTLLLLNYFNRVQSFQSLLEEKDLTFLSCFFVHIHFPYSIFLFKAAIPQTLKSHLSA